MPQNNAAAGLPPMDMRAKQPPQPINKNVGDVFADLLADYGIKKKITLEERLRTEETKLMGSIDLDMLDWTTTPKIQNNAATSPPPLNTNPQPPPPNDNKSRSDVLADLLAGFAEKATMGEMLRTEETKFMDPIAIKMRDWTKGKNGNIRALLSSLDEVLWPEAGTWRVPSITDMLNDNVVKKVYLKACLLVHPDKQVGQPHHALAQAIFTELNKAMIAFDDERK